MSKQEENDIASRLYRAAYLIDRAQDVIAAFDEFMPDCRIAIDDTVETACIRRRGEQHEILFGRRFLQEQLADDRDLLFVFLHEIYHHVLGQLAGAMNRFDSPYEKLASNIAADMMVNRAVCERFFPAGVPLLRRLYRPGKVPECLLLPYAERPKDVVTGTGPFNRFDVWATKRAILTKAGVSGRLRNCVLAAYDAGWMREAPFPRLVEMTARVLKAMGVKVTAVFLLGDHETIGTPLPGVKWDRLTRREGDGGGEGSDAAEEYELPEGIRPIRSAILAQAVSVAMDHDMTRTSQTVLCHAGHSPVFSPGRPDFLALAIGQWPAMFHGPQVRFARDENVVHLYLDVSGSIHHGGILPFLYSVVSSLGERFGGVIHLFSTEVIDVTLEDVASGRVKTTGGTDFDCVLLHAMKSRYRNILLVSDGKGNLSTSLVERFARTGGRFYLVLTGDHPRGGRGPLARLAARSWELEANG